MAENNLPQRIGKYTVLGLLGRGAMGVVYKGLDPLIQRPVALKIIRKAAFDDDELTEALGRFRREAQAAGRLIHPNIVTVYEYGEENDTAFIAMEYVEGKSLKEVLKDKQSFTLAEVADIIRQLVTGLHYAHRSGIVHRDIKPDNLIFAQDGTLKIMDFGIARLESSSLTMAGSVMGTPSYMAPELFSGEEVDQRSDLFSAGIILYQLLTGRKPFAGSSMTTIMHQVVNIMPPKPSQLDNRLPAPLDNLIQTCLAKNPDIRFQNGADFGAALDRAFSKVDSTLVTLACHGRANSDQEATLYEPGLKPAPQQAILDKIKHHSLPISIGFAAAFIVIVLFFLLRADEPSLEVDAGQTAISSQHKKSAVPKTLSPSAAKKKTASQPAKPRTGIAITTPNPGKRKKDQTDRPASRNAITITVPDRR
ncbi:MAG: serine/threonine-protein kinase [Thermodesulfobacteriota bacterium]